MGNREFKSDVFSMLLEDKRNALQVYNAVNGTHYSNPEEIEIVTLEKGISLSVRNDAAFILGSELSVYEHQSTVCPNMPIRNLFYFSDIIEKRVKEENLFGSKLVRIPAPKFVVFYNGTVDQPEKQVYRLSDAYEKPMDSPELELKCTVYNINKGMNKELLSNCQVLSDYMFWIEKIKENRLAGMDLSLAINEAIEYCIDHDVMSEFLRSRKDDVTKMTNLDYTFERQIELEKKSSYKEGLAEGRQLGLSEGREEGREEGQSSLVEACLKLKEGISEEKLLADGYSEKTIQMARKLL